MRHEPDSDWSGALSDRLDALLPDVAVGTRRELDRSARPRTFRRGDVLVAQGRASQLVLLLDGFGAIRRGSREGKQLLLFVASAGELLCVSAVTFAESPFDLTCLTDGTAATWSGSQIRELADHDPAFGLWLLDRAVAIGLQVTARVDTLVFLDARRRLLRAFAEHGDLVFDRRQPVISRSDLPALVGTSREMVARCLRSFEAEGIVARIGRTGLVLRDADRLRQETERG